MGLFHSPPKCFITDKPTEDLHRSSPTIEYHVEYFGNKYFFRFNSNHKNSDLVNSNIFSLRGLLLNNKFPDIDITVFDNDILEKLILESGYPRTPKEKFDNLLLKLYDYQEFDGQTVRSNQLGEPEAFIIKLYFKNQEEFDFYFQSLLNVKLINSRKVAGFGMKSILDYTITMEGLKYIMDLEKEGPLSKNCFIAMSFDESLNDLREAIKQAIIETGFQPLIVDEQHQKSDETINDAIINQIRKSRFCIADFTQHKRGVYFEAGYSIGKGLKVIYCCTKKDFKDAHFDINHYQHIIYETPNELKQKLIDKIEAWIK